MTDKRGATVGVSEATGVNEPPMQKQKLSGEGGEASSWNDKLADALEQHGRDTGTLRAFAKAVRSIREHPEPIKSGNDARQLPNVGEKAASAIDEVIQKGDLESETTEREQTGVASVSTSASSALVDGGRGLASLADSTCWIVHYTYVDDFENKARSVFPEHERLVDTMSRDGTLLLAGPTADPIDSAFLLIDAPDQNTVEDFVKNDPLFKQNLITDYVIRHWNIVGGAKSDLLKQSSSGDIGGEGSLFVVKYDYVDDFEQKAQSIFPDHTKVVEQKSQEGMVLLAGPTSNPIDKAFLVVSAPDQQTVEEFVKNDPLFKNDLVPNFLIRRWNLVGGSKFGGTVEQGSAGVM